MYLFCFLGEFVGKTYLSKPSWIYLRWELVVPLLCLAKLSNSWSVSIHRSFLIKWILTSAVIFPVLSMDLLEFFGNFSISSGFTFLKLSFWTCRFQIPLTRDYDSYSPWWCWIPYLGLIQGLKYGWVSV